MPSALNKDGYNFYFYSNEHEPIHVHVRSIWFGKSQV